MSSYTILLLVLRASSWMWIPSSSQLFDSSKLCHVTVPMQKSERACIAAAVKVLQPMQEALDHGLGIHNPLSRHISCIASLPSLPLCMPSWPTGSPSVLKTLNRLNPSNPSRLHQPKSLVQRNAPSQPKRATKMTSTASHRSLRDTARKQPAHDTLICPPILATHQFRFFGF